MINNQILFKKIRRIINKYDPIKLISIGCPKDEYDPEIKLILNDLSKCKSIKEINNLVYNIFVEMFEYGGKVKNFKDKKFKKIDPGYVGKKKSYNPIAKEIYFLMKVKKCPQCKNIMKKVEVKVWGAKNTILTNQCAKCGYFDSNKKSLNRILREIRTNLKEKEKHYKEI